MTGAYSSARDTFTALWADLDVVRERRGLSRQALAGRAGQLAGRVVPAKTLHDRMANGRRVPWDEMRAVVLALDLNEHEWRPRWEHANGNRHRAIPPTAQHARDDGFAVSGETSTGTPVRGSHRPESLPLAQLPRDPNWFIGREGELEYLMAIASRPHRATAAKVISIDGMAGIGKTALAVYAAHKMAERYPDGQLFVDLRGSTEAMTPVSATDVLDRMLRALGVPGGQVPDELDDRAALWRSLLTKRQMMIVLDNAATESQVAPLLPGVSSCLVVVTSRRRLAGLEPSHVVSLGTLQSADAVTLFARAAGSSRLGDEDDRIVAEAVELCGRLPLAVRIAAARLRSRPAWTVMDLVERLRDQEQRLEELEDGQRSVRTALELSYLQMAPDQRRMYRLLGLHPGPDTDAYAAAALADTSLVQARRLLDQLLDIHLLHEPAAGRYRFHDLVRVHAAATAASDEPSSRQAALTRLLDHYRYTTATAMDVAYPFDRGSPPIPTAESQTPDLPNPVRATGWLDAELSNILAAARYAAGHGFREHTLHLSTILSHHLRARTLTRDAESLHHQALTIARTAGDRVAEVGPLLALSDVYVLQCQFDRATDQLQRAREIAHDDGNRSGEAAALLGLSMIQRLQSRYRQAAENAEQGLEIARHTGNRAVKSQALCIIGFVNALRGQLGHAIDQVERALEIARNTGNPIREISALTCVGYVSWLQGRYERVEACYEQALEITRNIRCAMFEPYVLVGLGYVPWRRGQYQQAIDYFERALEVARVIGNVDAQLKATAWLGHAHRMNGCHAEAQEEYQHALGLAPKIGNRHWQFEAIHGLGRLHHAAGRPDIALAHHQRALDLATHLGNPFAQARAHDGLAHAHASLNRPAEAGLNWQSALDTLSSLGIDQTEDQEASASTIRARLTNLDRTSVSSLASVVP